MSRHNAASLMLVLVTAVWGVSFPLMKSWQDAAADAPGGPALAACMLISVRMAVAVLAVIAISPRRTMRTTPAELWAGLVVGTVFGCGFILQVFGLSWTTPARSGFITGLSNLGVPFVLWAGWHVRPRGADVAGLACALAGVGVMLAPDLMTPPETGRSPIPGDLLTLAAAVFFALQVVLLDRFGRTCDSGNMTPSFFLAAGLLAQVVIWLMFGAGVDPGTALGWAFGRLTQPAVAAKVAVLSIACTALAFHWMNTYQPRVPASRAALIYLLEPVFAALFAVLMGVERLSAWTVAGGALVIAGNLAVEWLARPAAVWPGADGGPKNADGSELRRPPTPETPP